MHIMKTNIFKRILCGVLTIVSLLSLCSCAGDDQQVVIPEMEAEEVAKVTFDFLGGEDVMPLSGYYGPNVLAYSMNGDKFPDYISDDIMQKIADCGINMMHYCGPGYQSTREALFDLLELGDKYGVGIFVVDSELARRSQEGGNAITDAKFRATKLARYTQYDSMCGVYMIDEPGVAYYHPQSEAWRDLSMQVEASKGLNNLGIVPSINLLPPVTKEDYEPWNRYVKEYIETCEPRYISYDCYPYISYGNKEVYFYSMDKMLSYAKQYNIPFWSYIQVGDESERGSYDIDEGELNWNVNTTLCFGVKGLEYYLVIQPKSMTQSYTPGQDYDFQRVALLGADGSKTQWWYYTQKINTHIRAIDSVLMNSTHKGVIATGESALKLTTGLENMFEGDSWRELKSVEGDVMIGCYNYQGKTALYVTNFEEAYAQKVTLNLHGTYNLSVTQDAKISYIQTNELELDLKAGEGVLVVFD